MLGGAAFGAKVAQSASVHVMLNPVDASVNVVNSLFAPSAASLVVVARLASLNGTVVWSATHTLLGPVASNGVVRRVLSVPVATVLAEELRFVALQLLSPQGDVLDHNVYWLPANSKQDVYEIERGAEMRAWLTATVLVQV